MPGDNAEPFLQNATPHTLVKWAAGPCRFGNFQLKFLMFKLGEERNGESEVMVSLRRMAVARTYLCTLAQ
jgi:hypothetical protein